jgi:hypothetical protein
MVPMTETTPEDWGKMGTSLSRTPERSAEDAHFLRALREKSASERP